ncbi:hypothetical protein AAFF_G00098730 [Aldrovandia affinis]|uniref:Uncharacterized protein n=1 Tax=Aldrovandia affinis TaxID=143900 RepID=A0AAD7RVB1_9TELE|nr:hypothetical protein AAFF_G00098730 [Aldrovandia affinis]
MEDDGMKKESVFSRLPLDPITLLTSADTVKLMRPGQMASILHSRCERFRHHAAAALGCTALSCLAPIVQRAGMVSTGIGGSDHLERREAASALISCLAVPLGALILHKRGGLSFSANADIPSPFTP